MINVNEYLDCEEDMKLCSDCVEKVEMVLDTLDDFCEFFELEEDGEEELIIEILDDFYEKICEQVSEKVSEKVFALAYHEGFRDCVKQNLTMQNDLLEELDDMEFEEDEYEELDLYSD